MKTGQATLPLHGGQCPAWLFQQDIHHSYLTLKRALKKAKCGQREGLDALKRLLKWYQHSSKPFVTPSTPPLENQHFAKRSIISSSVLERPNLFV